MLEGCVAAAPKESTVTNVSMQNSLSGGIGWSSGGVGVGTTMTETLKVSFVSPVVLGFDLIDFVPSAGCRDKLASYAARGGDLSRVVVVQEALMARVNGCEQLGVGVELGVGGAALRSGASTACQMFSEAPVAVGVKSVSIAKIPELAGLIGGDPGAAPAPAAPADRLPISMVDRPSSSAFSLKSRVDDFFGLRLDGIPEGLSMREESRRLKMLLDGLQETLDGIRTEGERLARTEGAPIPAEALVLVGIATEWSGEAIETSFIPSGLTGEQIGLYQDGLRDKAAEAEASAVSTYRRALEQAAADGTSTEATAWACTRLRQHDPEDRCAVSTGVGKGPSARDAVVEGAGRLRSTHAALAGCRAYTKDGQDEDVAMILDQADQILAADEASMMADILEFLVDKQRTLDGYTARCR